MVTLQQDANNSAHFGCFPAIGPFEIPRPKCIGMKFVSIRGRYGYYQTVNKNVALKYGLQQRNGMRRPTLPEKWVETEEKKANIREEEEEEPEGMKKEVEEPTPDYEEDEEGRKRTDRIATPNGQAPPAPPLPVWLRVELLQGKSPKKGIKGGGKSPFDLLMANGGHHHLPHLPHHHHPFMATFREEEEMEADEKCRKSAGGRGLAKMFAKTIRL